MASLYRQKESGVWWIKFRDTRDGKIKRKSTHLRIGIGPDTRMARELCAEKTLAEAKIQSISGTDLWSIWVTQFISTRCAGRTLERYLGAWRSLRLYLEERNIAAPIQLTRQHCFDYFAWREKPDKKNGKYRAGRNTAILETKVLGAIMKEAVWRGLAPANPCRELGIKRTPRRLFAELTDRDVQFILAAVEQEPEPERTRMRRAFLVALYHGVRLNETNVNPMADVRLWPREMPADFIGPRQILGTIRFFQKGGKEKTKPLHPALVPLFAGLQRGGATQTYPGGRWGNRWTKFLNRCGVRQGNPDITFHSLRVTVKSRLRRADIGKELAMEYLSHEAADVDESYNRFTVDDLRPCHAALEFHLPSSPA